MEAYEQLLALGRERAGISTATAQPARVLHAAGKAQAELTARANAEGILSAEEVEKRIDALDQLELACAPIQQDIDKGQAQFAKLEAETQKALDRADINKMEQDLWIYWIHSLAVEERREVLKNSALQERFMGIGLAGGEASRLREKTSAFESPGAPDVAGATEDEYRLLQLVGKQGTATSDLKPYGRVNEDGTEVVAHSIAGELPKGTAIRGVGTTKTNQRYGRALEVDRVA